MPDPRFRFRPPAVAGSPELRWTLAAAFGPTSPYAAPDSPATALETASRLALLPRIASRAGAERPALAGDPVAPRLRDERALAAARELQHDATLAEVAGAAADVGAVLALLKGRALVAAGYAAAGARPAGDLDLLVPSHRLEPLRRALLDRGFSESPDEHEHQVPSLHRAGLASVELHRHLPGVRLDGRRSADWTALLAGGRLRPLEGGTPGLLAPARDVLVAHALVHALAQHGHHAAYPGWLLIADLIDLDAVASDADESWREWIERDVSRREIDAALDLARRVAAGEDPLAAAPDGDAARLARHFVAAALDDDYRDALKLRWLESPLSDRPRWRARLAVLARAFVPPRRSSPGGAPEPGLRRALRWIVRPLRLVARTLRGALAGRRIGRAGD